MVESPADTVLLRRAEQEIKQLRAQLAEAKAENERVRDSNPDDIRALGWTLAVHNDYSVEGSSLTFWLFTDPKTGRFLKGEGYSDAAALNRVREALKRDPSPSEETEDQGAS